MRSYSRTAWRSSATVIPRRISWTDSTRAAGIADPVLFSRKWRTMALRSSGSETPETAHNSSSRASRRTGKDSRSLSARNLDGEVVPAATPSFTLVGRFASGAVAHYVTGVTTRSSNARRGHRGERFFSALPRKRQTRREAGTQSCGLLSVRGGTVKAARLPKGWTGPVSKSGRPGPRKRARIVLRAHHFSSQVLKRRGGQPCRTRRSSSSGRWQ
jgi:hypothetical protein